MEESRKIRFVTEQAGFTLCKKSGGTVEFELSKKPCELFGEYVPTAF